VARSAKMGLAGKLQARRAGGHRLASLAHVEPYQQGEFDGLCGIYAVVNALRLLVASQRPLSYVQCARLYGRGVEIVRRRDRLAFAATFGISQTLWRQLAAALCASAGRIVGFAICPVLPFASISRVPRARVFAAIEEAIDAEQPVLVALLGAYNHYTVISAYTATRFVLHDSYGYHWISKASCGVSHDGSTSRHQIATRSVIVLRLRRCLSRQNSAIKSTC
jgi:hypothetical protein